MFHYWSFKGIDALVSRGLGGGSLIYANVLIRKDEHWFVHEDLDDGGYEYWPVTRADLDPHYDRVEQMLGLQRYPFDHEPYALDAEDARLQGGGRGARPRVVPAPARGHVRQRGPPAGAGRADRGGAPEPARPHRTTCQLCGECDVGCNYGAKNTLDYTYLTHAKHHGAEIRTLAEVRRFEPRGGRRLRRPLRRPRRATPRGAGRRYDADLRPPDPQRRHARHDVPAAAQPQRASRALAQARHALLRQRRPADARARTRSAGDRRHARRRGSSTPATAR